MLISAYKPMSSGALKGFCDVQLPSGMMLHRCSIFVKDGRTWASPPSKQVIGREGTVQRGADGKVLYEPTALFIDRATQERWSAAVTDALRASHPEALAEADG